MPAEKIFRSVAANICGSNKTSPLDEETLVSLKLFNAHNMILRATGPVLLSGENGNKPFPLPADTFLTFSGPLGPEARIYVTADSGASGAVLHAFAWAPE